jgi:hypothetical protein
VGQFSGGNSVFSDGINKPTARLPPQRKRVLAAVPRGTPKAGGGILVSTLAAGAGEVMFYAASNRGLYCSKDDGENWEQIGVEWPERYHTASAGIGGGNGMSIDLSDGDCTEAMRADGAT